MEMLRKTLVVVLVLAVVAFTAGVAMAGAMKAAGEVVKADPAGKSLVLMVDGKAIALNVSDQAAKSLAGLKPGDQVTVSYEESDGKRTATAIEKPM